MKNVKLSKYICFDIWIKKNNVAIAKNNLNSQKKKDNITLQIGTVARYYIKLHFYKKHLSLV